MPDLRKRAFAAASAYAPKPNGSLLLYGLITAVLFGMAALFVGGFYAVDLTSYPLLIGAGLILAFGFGMLFRIRRKRRHKAAVAIEHQRLAPEANSAT